MYKKRGGAVGRPLNISHSTVYKGTAAFLELIMIIFGSNKNLSIGEAVRIRQRRDGVLSRCKGKVIRVATEEEYYQHNIEMGFTKKDVDDQLREKRTIGKVYFYGALVD